MRYPGTRSAQARADAAACGLASADRARRLDGALSGRPASGRCRPETWRRITRASISSARSVTRRHRAWSRCAASAVTIPPDPIACCMPRTCFMGSGDRRLADGAGDVGCATCHIEHRGRTLRVEERGRSRVRHVPQVPRLARPSRVCGRARAGHGRRRHRFRSRSSHRRGAEGAQARRAQTCHEQTGRSARLPADDVRSALRELSPEERHVRGRDRLRGARASSLPVEVPGAVQRGSKVRRFEPGPARQASGRRACVIAIGWMLYNAARLRRGIDREGDEAERVALRARIQYPPAARSRRRRHARFQPAELDAAIAALQDEIASSMLSLADRSGSDDDDEALQQLTAAAQAVSPSLASVDGGDRGAAAAAGRAPPPIAKIPRPPARLARRKAELLGVDGRDRASARRDSTGGQARGGTASRNRAADRHGRPSLRRDDAAAIAERLDRLERSC